ncbi:hypothetical protein DOY81_007984 [Sarcophaga bullata]|nr:hypothetical protein DOY81_007984 [Sarcophaga bullata]
MICHSRRYPPKTFTSTNTTTAAATSVTFVKMKNRKIKNKIYHQPTNFKKCGAVKAAAIFINQLKIYIK